MVLPIPTELDAAAAATPQLSFRVAGAEGVWPSAVPTLSFALEIACPSAVPIKSIVLDVQIRIAARRRGYADEEQAGLLELFGAPERWATTLRTLPWARTTIVVPAFTATVTVPVEVPCSYDLEVTGARYFAALRGGEVPLEFLFSGSTFYTGAHGALQTTRIAWDTDADYRLPVEVWRATMERHFAGRAWLRLGTGTLGRLAAYKARHAFTSWDAALEALLDGEAAP